MFWKSETTPVPLRSKTIQESCFFYNGRELNPEPQNSDTMTTGVQTTQPRSFHYERMLGKSAKVTRELNTFSMELCQTDIAKPDVEFT